MSSPIAGGYFLTRTVERPESVAADLIPERMLSLSDCFCEFIPDIWAVAWAQVDADERMGEARKFGIAESALGEVLEWTTKRMNSDTLGWPCVFLDLGEAREFRRRFLSATSNLELIGIALPPELLDDFLSDEKPEENQGVPGIYKAIDRRSALEGGGSELGWEVLCYQHGGFHSWLCNGLERDVADRCGIQPAQNGFIADPQDAMKAAEYCGSDEVGAEPGFWAPWQIVEYPPDEA